MKSKQLKRRYFDDLIFDSYMIWLEEEGNLVPDSQRNEFTPDFNPEATPNRNPKQVPNGTWKKLIRRHVRTYNYN